MIFRRLGEKCAAWREDALLPPLGKTDRILLQIDHLHTLKERGAITEEEYDSKKAELLKRI